MSDSQLVGDPRVAGKVGYGLPTMLTALVMSMATMARSLRAVEQRTGQLSRKRGRWMGIESRIADNTFGKVIPRLSHDELMQCLHRLVKAEHRRGNLKPTRLKQGTVAIDGKNVATPHWPDKLRLLKLHASETTVKQATALFAERYPQAQVCTRENGEPYALLRMHTATLVSGDAAVCVHQRPIAGHTNESWSMPALLDELKAAYGKTWRFSLVTTPSDPAPASVFSGFLSLRTLPTARGQRQLRQRRRRHAPAGRGNVAPRQPGRDGGRTCPPFRGLCKTSRT